MPDPSPAVRIEVDGITYRVFDATMREGKLLVANPPVAWATSRVFRPKVGHRRLFRLRTPEDRRIDQATLRRQLASADYLGTGPTGAPNVDPR